MKIIYLPYFLGDSNDKNRAEVFSSIFGIVAKASAILVDELGNTKLFCISMIKSAQSLLESFYFIFIQFILSHKKHRNTCFYVIFLSF
jgi:hypothetical protein